MPIGSDQLAETVAQALADRADALDEEQSVQGVDALKETQLHDIAADGAAGAGFGVFREVPFPALDDPTIRTTARQRCDLVLTPDPSLKPVDTLAVHNEREAIGATLFAQTSLAAEPVEGVCQPEDACWIEIKTTALFACRDGVFVPNRTYSSELVNGLTTDSTKLASDDRIWHALFLLIVFGEDERQVERDIRALAAHGVDSGLPIRSPTIVSRPINNRAGNGAFGVGAFELSL